MKTIEYVAMRARGIAVIVVLCMALGLVLGLLGWIQSSAPSAQLPGYMVGASAYLGVLALVTNTPVIRWLVRDLDNTVVLIIVTLLVTIPFWVLVFPMQFLALRSGWVERVGDGDE